VHPETTFKDALPVLVADRSLGLLHRVATEMRSLADRDPSIALELSQMAAELESAADLVVEGTAPRYKAA
jgi:hypothetical protein